MIKAQFYKVADRYCGFCVSGHALYDESGQDIVCASVSSAVQMAANTITEIIAADASVKVEEDGAVNLRLVSGGGEKIESASAVISGLRLHLTLLSKQYKGTIGIDDSEV
ncbi:MAG TPA: ribosomal-processing cysteine protease Prp [Ruminiclostridium sp.]|nr:ribosomal-processing cysteine protease Prp [Ruminiclostridium sp.]